MKSGAPFFRIDIMYMIYLDVKYFSVVCLSIYYEKLAVKTTLTTMGHFFGKKLNYCPSDIICNLCIQFAYSCFSYIQQVMRRSKFTSIKPWKLETLILLTVKESLFRNLLRRIVSSVVNKNYYYVVILFLCYVFPFASEDFVFPLLRWIINGF